ncbi:ATP synthase F1 subunit gamma [Conexibacter sp. JD483]|uniref:ATP synthase F1 subunit gamma n=1 Tax=unclassified Conexibacter TaxID=2627773 RepID=UPI0027194218|nr:MULTISPECIES: ATP synthase F1 subunit gamma [unclassified Conexibacter]MDO8186765.1 ATP synthase F1 subunit gamma [Conexibacter sp. CPCC 205706]MDO8199051.1 ATP synthase F1 subunit gamma [Conexibacter sp. CPCC 205762]MDR9368503.1 ATP synthase F1 subunit gamma [Conexibacter sp. JD483]
MAQRDVKNRIASVKNIQKITRAMEMVAAARLRRAETRIAALRPYAGAIRRMTRQAAEAAGDVPALPILADREQEERVALLLVTADRGLAGAFNSQIIRAGIRAGDDHVAGGREVVYYATGRRGLSSLTFRNRAPEQAFTGFTERPSYANAREISHALTAAYVDGKVDRVEILYNGYISPMSQEVRRETLLPLQKATILDAHEDDAHAAGESNAHALVDYEPEPEEILERLVPDYVEISIFRALLESTASELGARMTAMRSASDNAGEIIDDLTLEMNRARQAEITQEIMEVVAGAEALG